MTQAPAAQRETGAEQVLWDLSIFYDGLNDPRITADLAEAQQKAEAFAARWRGRVATLTGAEMLEALAEEEAIGDQFYSVISYAQMQFTINTQDPARGALLQKVSEAGAVFAQTTMFFDLEWKALDDEAAAALLAQIDHPNHAHALESARRLKPYTLSEPLEQLLVETTVTGNSAWVRFFEQFTSAWTFTLKQEDGTDDPKPYTQSKILALLQSSDRGLRQRAADSMTAVLKRDSMTLTYILNTVLADKDLDDRRRKLPTWITSRNLSNKAPDRTVDALIEAVTSRYDICQRHYNLKRTLLGYDELFDYDRYAPLAFDTQERFYTWGEARDVVQSAYDRFSPRVGEVVRRFFDEQWIHAPSLPGKGSGAYATPTVPSKHPFVFMNFVGKERDVMTLAHELGHGLHMYLGGRANGMHGLYTPLTTAEMASTFGEMLTFDDVMATQADPLKRLAMIFGKSEDSFATIFRQIAMNRFEHGLHTARRAEGELSPDRVRALWLETQRQQFGTSVTLREDYGYWYGYIGHFIHTPGYVYAYSFGELLVLALFNLYKQQGPTFADEYIGVLEAGNTNYPDKLLARVGVDLNDPSFWHQGLDLLDAMVTEEETLARTLFPEKFA